MGTATGYLLLIPPMAASMALVAGAPGLPLSQPRGVIGGQILSAMIGVLVGTLGHSVWLAALAGGLALGGMMLTRTAHSPAAATAVIAASVPAHGEMRFIMCVGLAATVLVGFGVLRAHLDAMQYPVRWW